jgi:hypothetical protein
MNETPSQEEMMKQAQQLLEKRGRKALEMTRETERLGFSLD